MNLKPTELSKEDYILLDKLDHMELVPFIKKYINKRTNYSYLYYFLNILILILSGYFLFLKSNQYDLDFEIRFTHFCYGIAIAFLITPIHEYIHVLAYKSQGANQTRYGANFKKFYFMALADNFVANKKEFEIVALAPFLTITTILTILLFLVPIPWKLCIIGILLAHTAMCSGDFGLLSYFSYHKDKNVVTYDDIASGVTYFYGKQT